MKVDPSVVDVGRLFDSASGRLEIRLAVDSLDWQDQLMVVLACPALDRSSKSNWVEKAGGLPRYICEVATDIHEERGKSISNAIQIAIGIIKRWAKGVGNVDAKTRAKAAEAVAQWEALKAKARAT